MAEWSWAVLLSSILLGIFALSNYLHDLTGNFVISRKCAHFGAGAVILPFPLVFEGMLYPVLLPALFLLGLYIGHRTELFHGFVRKARIAELGFAAGVLVSMAVAWRIDPWLATVPVMFMSMGDGSTGLVRWLHHRGQAGFRKYWCGTIAMGIICLPFSFLISPYWIGLVGAAAATAVEKVCGDVSIINIDDNLTVPLVSLAVMVPLYVFFGG